MSGLLLRPFVAAAAVAVLVALPVAVLGELSDTEARLRAQAEMFEAGAGVAERAGLALEKRLSEYREGLTPVAAGDLRRAIPARDAKGIWEAALRALNLTRRANTYLATRALVTDAQGQVLIEIEAMDEDLLRRSTVPALDPSGRRDQLATTLIPEVSIGVMGSLVSRPYVLKSDQPKALISIAAGVFPNEVSRTVIGLLILELPMDVLQESLTALVPKADDIYVVGRSGVLWFSARPKATAPLADLMGNPVVAKSIRSQPVFTRDPVSLREYGPDPFTGATRPFATAVIDPWRDLVTIAPGRTGGAGATATAATIEPWHVFVVPHGSTLASAEATLTQLRWVRSGLALVLVIGAFTLAVAVRAVVRQRAALAAANEALGRASRAVEAASRHKSEFLANMSHELRTPLNAVIGFSDVLGQRFFGDLNAKQAEYVTDIAASGHHLLDLVNEILDLSKVEAGRMDLEETEFAPSDTIRGALAFLRERAARHGIELAAEVPADLGVVVADERKFRQVLLNLLSNAVKFTPDGGWIGVTAVRRDGEVVVSVRDSGVGIAPEDQATVFEEFRQVGKDAGRSREGTGLGLTLAKRFVELHGGRIWVDSEVGKGSTFTFSIPVRQTAAAPARG